MIAILQINTNSRYIMDRQYLESFNNEQLQHYLKTLKRRISDLRELTLQLGKENQELGGEYQALAKEKLQVYKANEQKKKSWSKWLNKGKQKLTNIFHIAKKQQKKQEPHQEMPQPIPQQTPNQQIEQPNLQVPNDQPKQSPPKKLTLPTFNFDDLYHIGKEKLTGLFKKNKEGYHPNEKDKYELEYPNRQQPFRENIQLIREITGEHSEFAAKEETVQERELKRRLLVQAELAKKSKLFGNTHIQLKGQGGKKQPFRSTQKLELTQKASNSQSVAIEKDLHELRLSQIIPEKDTRQIQTQEVENLEAEEEQDNEYGVHFDSQMDSYELKQQNLSQIVEKQAQIAPESQEDIDYHPVDKKTVQQDTF